MQVIADSDRVAELIAVLAGQIGQSMHDVGHGQEWALVGIRSRGDLLARRLAGRVGIERVGTLDITLYRDDLSEIGHQPVVRTTEIGFPIDALQVVLVDDVLMTGRSVRAALQQLMDLGRPRRVWLAVLVDRGGRELPIAPDHIGLNLLAEAAAGVVDAGDRVDVYLHPTDERDQIVVRHAGEDDG